MCTLVASLSSLQPVDRVIPAVAAARAVSCTVVCRRRDYRTDRLEAFGGTRVALVYRFPFHFEFCPSGMEAEVRSRQLAAEWRDKERRRDIQRRADLLAKSERLKR